MTKKWYKAAVNKVLELSPYLFLFVIFIFIWRINTLTPLWADDYCRIASSTSAFEAIAKAFDRYFTLNGRFFVNVVSFYVFGNYPSSMAAFNLINSVFFILLVMLVFTLAFARRPKGLRDINYLLFIFVMLFVATRGIGEVAFWKSGSIGYLWGVTLELVVLLPLFLVLNGKRVIFSNKYLRWGYYTLVFISATFIEHMSFAISLIFLFILLKAYVKKTFLPNSLRIAAPLHLAGGLLLLFSKGNMIKSALQHIRPLNESILGNLAHLQPIIQGTLGLVFLAILPFALSNRNFSKNLKDSSIWTALSLALMVFLTFSILPTEQPFIYRIAFPFEVFVILTIMHLARYFPRVLIFEITIFILMGTVVLAHGAKAYKDAKFINRQILARNELIKSQKLSGSKTLLVPKLSVERAWDNFGRQEYVSKYNYVSDIGVNPNDWTNSCFAKAVGLDEVAVREQEE